MALLATATHVVLMATSVVADILMLYDEDGVDVERVVHDAVGTRMRLADLQMLDGGTHHTRRCVMPRRQQSEGVQRSSKAGPSSIVLPCVAAAEQDSASDG